MNRRSFMGLATTGLSMAAVHSALEIGPTFRSAVAGTLPASAERPPSIPLVGEFGYGQTAIRDLPTGTTIDATRAVFIVANSRNGSPVKGSNCEHGWLPLNRYPVVVRNCPNVKFIGGRFDGEVPLTSMWRDTYCNSAALLLRSGSSEPRIEGLRMRRCWDGVRFGDGCGDFRLQGSWFSEIRDDAVENDYLFGGTIEDCLIDGCFSGISLDPASNDRDGSNVIMTVDRCLIRMQPFATERGSTHGSPFKMTKFSPRLRLLGTTIALSAANMRQRRLRRTWDKTIESRGNTLLWLSDGPLPRDFVAPPSGFRVLTGVEARYRWQEARSRWIDAHPQVARFSIEK